jgi:hypothetical protein
MQTYVSSGGATYEWDDTFQSGDIIVMEGFNGYFVFSHYDDRSVSVNQASIPYVVGTRLLNKEGNFARHAYTQSCLAHYCMRAETKLEYQIDKKITEAAKLNIILQKIKK